MREGRVTEYTLSYSGVRCPWVEGVLRNLGLAAYTQASSEIEGNKNDRVERRNYCTRLIVCGEQI